jgi:hypothetical protein
MIGRIAAGLTTVGLIGGAGAIVYDDDGTAKVTITDKSGSEQTVTLGGAGDGKTYDCPAGTEDKLSHIDVEAGRIKITLREVRGDRRDIRKRYPGHAAPDPVAKKYNKLLRRERDLVRAFNVSVDKHNAVIDADCTEA